MVLQDTESSSLCCILGPCCLSLLYIVVCTDTPKLLIYPSLALSPLVTVSLLPMSMSLFLFFIYLFICFYLFL